MATRLSLDDLWFASKWIEAYDPEVEPENKPRQERLLAWLDEQIKARENRAIENAAVRQMAQERNTTPAAIRASPEFKRARARTNLDK